MNRGFPSPGIGLAAPGDPRLVSKIILPNAGTTIPTQANACLTTSSQNHSNHEEDDDDEVQIISQLSQRISAPLASRKGLKVKSRPKKNDRLANNLRQESEAEIKPASPPKINIQTENSNSAKKDSLSKPTLEALLNEVTVSSSSTKTLPSESIPSPVDSPLNQSKISYAKNTLNLMENPNKTLNENNHSCSEPQRKNNKSAPDVKMTDPNYIKVNQSLPSKTTPFSWDIYLKLMPADIAPKEAFRQAIVLPANDFKPGMRLEAKDPRNPTSWCLATVFSIHGLRLRLRFDGSDSMNDFFELVDSENIRPVGSKPSNILYPPMAYKGNHSTYPKFVERVLSKEDTILAPAEYFKPVPKGPESNLFKEGMKLEAIDRKNPYLICPATVGGVNDSEIKIVFDGWKGSFDYSCKYNSRDIFPVNWCHDSNHHIMTPNGWEGLLNKKPGTEKRPKSPINKGFTNNRPNNLQSTSKGSRVKLSHKPIQKSKVLSSTPKKEKKIREPETFIQDEEPDLDDGNRYQCQRAVPYTEWRKTKEEKMKEDVIVPESVSSDVSLNPLLNLSDSTSLASTLSGLDDSGANASELETKDLLEEKKDSSEEKKDSSEETEVSSPETEDTLEEARIKKRMKVEDTYEAPSQSNGTSHLSSSYDDWSVSEVIRFVSTDESLAKYSHIFENNEIDGRAFVLLTTDMMLNVLGMKLGPVLKINDMIRKMKQNK